MLRHPFHEIVQPLPLDARPTSQRQVGRRDFVASVAAGVAGLATYLGAARGEASRTAPSRRGTRRTSRTATRARIKTDEEGLWTTLALGEEGGESPGHPPAPPDDGVYTTLALGEEG